MEFALKAVDKVSQSISYSTVCCAVILGIYLHYRNKYSYWKRLGVKYEAPWPIVGEIYNLFLMNRLSAERERVERNGKVYGTYIFGGPRLVVADPEVIRQICIKDFDVFPNHSDQSWHNRYQALFLVWIKGEQWKKTRSLMSPTFTSGKIKKMFNLIDICADDLIDSVNEMIDENKDGKINLKDAFGLFSMNGISTCGYGLRLERDSTNLKKAASRNEFVKYSMKIFDYNKLKLVMVMTLPHFILKAFGFQMRSEADFKPLVQRMRKLVEIRRSSPKKSNDLLQSLVDAKLGDEMELNEMDNQENHHAGLTRESLLEDQQKLLQELKNVSTITEDQANGGSVLPVTKYNLSEDEIIAEAIFLMAAGLDTTSTLLTNCSYLLALHPNVQEKLYNELKQIAEFDADKKKYQFEYEKLTSCQYLDAVISESLRILPPAPMTDRQSERDYHIEKYNITIPKGTKLLLGLYAVQSDPEYWYKPEKFDPNRFMPGEKEKIVPGSYAPFSMGPRHCIGMRFSLTEAKLGLAKIIMNFKIRPAPGARIPPDFLPTPGILHIKRPFAIIKRRSD